MITFWTVPKINIVGVSMRSLTTKPGDVWETNDKRPVLSAEALPEIGGRVCYQSFGKGRTSNAEYIKNILDKGHESVLEHAVVTFGIEGISRSCSHEFVRHRHLSFSQMSQRYVQDLAFVFPPDTTDSDMRDVRQLCLEATRTYNILLDNNKGSDKKTANAIARAVLPNCTETKMLVTGNLRAWRHFVKIRGTIHAEAEIRRLACMVLDLLKQVAPNVFQDLEVFDGTVRTIPPA